MMAPSSRGTVSASPVAHADGLKLSPRNGYDCVLITGGAGFIGTNLADRLLSAGYRVRILDNLSRGGSEENLAWLSAKHAHNFDFEKNDVRNFHALERCARDTFAVFHFAAQVAVTSSLVNPRYDFDVNAGGTLNLLEAIRFLKNPPVLLFSSTNKVYGALADLNLQIMGKRYAPFSSESAGINESRNLDFHSPYGCSKGAADQYILDYARTFHIPAIVFRMSCIYGPHQNGTEDQGWVAHFLIRANEHRPIRIYGDGRQVRDLLYITDLLDAFLLAAAHAETLAGQAFNIGGGLENSLSLLELLDFIRDLRGEPSQAQFDDWRHADQRYYISDTAKFQAAAGWKPRVSIHQGLQLLHTWLTERHNFPKVPAEKAIRQQPYDIAHP